MIREEKRIKCRRNHHRDDCWEWWAVMYYDRSHERRSRFVIVIAVTHGYHTISPLSHNLARGLVHDKEKKEKEVL